ncbi:MAG: hypothetical protein J0I24_14610 [Thiomonas arsenitoxydans]|uniref:Uncharacterized protein n=1 Tax=Thiomonas arsenitoxydans (strain DSM 22701 / CIP 110005 / 3As) TaxID=426114 RepID=A0A8I1MYP8_THIA3|nr:MULTISPECIES: hypothetical protein [Thiomonas]MBN8745514.1 hypothetical protein [Thiomonas arsenitoxydans]ODU96299.1 MAG: hypothetical protein ABT24_09545 [Thiomonas sp. SCN 64-16]
MTMKIERLLKKQAEIQAQIDAAKRHAKRKGQIGDLAEKAGALDLSDDEIIAALKAAVAATEAKDKQPAPAARAGFAATAATGATSTTLGAND